MSKYITRKLINADKKQYEYYTSNNKLITNKATLNKIYKIYIAPAYEDVKIYLDAKIEATGIDKKGIKQYVYSEASKKLRETKKYCQLVTLSSNISKLNKRIHDDMSVKKYNKNKIIALILKIMDICNFRCGTKKYEDLYGSHGLTTLHKKHILIRKNEVEIDFIGKKGVVNNCIINDNDNVQELIKSIYSLSSKDDPYFFSINYKNKHIKVSIGDLNNYLEQYNVTTKSLRTWNANILFLKNFKDELIENKDKDLTKATIKKRLVKEAIKKTAISLHHTPTICKNSYIYKNILQKIETSNKIIDKLLVRNSVAENILKDLLKNKDMKNCNKLNNYSL